MHASDACAFPSPPPRPPARRVSSSSEGCHTTGQNKDRWTTRERRRETHGANPSTPINNQATRCFPPPNLFFFHFTPCSISSSHVRVAIISAPSHQSHSQVFPSFLLFSLFFNCILATRLLLPSPLFVCSHQCHRRPFSHSGNLT